MWQDRLWRKVLIHSLPIGTLEDLVHGTAGSAGNHAVTLVSQEMLQISNVC